MRRFTRLRKLWKKRRRNMNDEAKDTSEDVMPAVEAPVVPAFNLILSLPPELLLVIFDWVSEMDCPDKSQKLRLLLTPLQINSQIRTLLWNHRPFWRLLMRRLGAVPTSYATNEILLNLCRARTNSTLDAFIFKPLDREGCMWIHSASRCLQIIKSSQSSLKLLVIPSYQFSVFCMGNPSPPSDVVKISGPIAHGLLQEPDRSHQDSENEKGRSDDRDSDQGEDDDDGYDEDDPMPHIEAMHDTIFTLISRALNLETLSWEISDWPSSEVLQSVAQDFAASPSNLQLSICNWLSGDKADAVVVLRAIARRAEVLYLHEAYNDDDTSEGWPTASHKLCPIVLQSASSTLRYLEIELSECNLQLKAFAEISFDVLESLFVVLREDEELDDFNEYWDIMIASASGSQCQMPSLETLHVPAKLLPVVEAPNIVQAGLTLERWRDCYSVTESLDDWDDLEILVLYGNLEEEEEDDDDWMDEYEVFGDACCYGCARRHKTPESAVDFIFKHLTPFGKSARCPDLMYLGIYDQPPTWSREEKSATSIESLPRDWDWREEPHGTHPGYSSSLGRDIAKMVRQRRSLSKEEEPCCVAIEEIRTIGIRIQRAARKYLQKLEVASFELSYEAVPQRDRRDSYSDIGAESDDDDWIRQAEERRVQLRAEKKKKEEEEKKEKQKALSEHQSSQAT